MTCHLGMNYRFIMFGNIRETSQNSGRDGNLNLPKCHVLDTYCEFRNNTAGAFCNCSMCTCVITVRRL